MLTDVDVTDVSTIIVDVAQLGVFSMQEHTVAMNADASLSSFERSDDTALF